MGILIKRSPRFYALYFLAWTALGLFFVTQGVLQNAIFRSRSPTWHIAAAWFTAIFICAVLSPAILWLGDRFPISRRNWSRGGLLHLLFAILFSIGQLACEAVVLPWMGVLPAVMKGFWTTFAYLLSPGFHSNILMYFTILGIQYGWGYYRKYHEGTQQAQRLQVHAAELKTQLAHAQLSALKTQLQPHFLFNTLNAIMVLVRQQKSPQAEEMLSRLSDLLRCVLEDVDAQEVTLRRELEYLQLYLSIEEVRFQDRLQVGISADPAILDAAVPHMGLQPIVENAIRHGLGSSSSVGKIQIRAAFTNDMLVIEVKDDGPGLPPPGSPPGRGIGLANTRARLHQLYGDAARLSVENGESGGVVATMVLPYRETRGGAEMEVMEVHALNGTNR